MQNVRNFPGSKEPLESNDDNCLKGREVNQRCSEKAEKPVYFYKASKKDGYIDIVDDDSALKLVRLGLISLETSKQIKLESDAYEIGLVILSGQCDISVNGNKFEGLGSRNNVFQGKPTTVYVPMQSDYEIVNTGSIKLEIAVCKVKADKKFEPFIVNPEDVIVNHRGKLNWQRDVYDIITYKYEGKVDKIVLGETYSCPGQWSSYPPHKHDRDNPPFEVSMEEVYFFKVYPSQGFGIQVLYNDNLTLDESYIVRDGDAVAISEGYHPVVAAPGYRVYYLWAMAGNSGRKLTPNDDPEHEWLKAVEAMV
ncbi:MAG: 5-deoxy-glucuronate isomerase [Bacillota bacterium]|nr:5-deoxy-glucuronate isomerase [Bacillota bacterium]